MNFIHEAENRLRYYRELHRSLEYMDKRISQLISQSKPKELSAISYDDDRVSGGKKQAEAIDVLGEIQTLVRAKQETEEVLKKIDDTLEEISLQPNCELYGLVLKLWYIEGRTKEDIGKEIGYSSIDKIYKIRNRALKRFAVLLFGIRGLEAI